MSSIVKTGTSAPVSSASPGISAIMKGLKSKLFDQLCLLVLDSSGSMSWELDNGMSKADITRQAVIDLVETLKRSSKSSGFHLAIVTYAALPEVRLLSQAIDSIKAGQIDLGEEFGLGPATRIDLALKKAEEVATAFINSKSPGSRLERTVRILLMSDGYCNMPENTREVATAIKEKHLDAVRICCCLLSAQDEEFFEEAEDLMKSVATELKNGKICYTNGTRGSDLRSFFERSSTEE